MNKLFKFATAMVLVFAVIFAMFASRTDTRAPVTKLESRTTVNRTEASTQLPPVKEQLVPVSRIALNVDADRQGQIRQSLPTFRADDDIDVPFVTFSDGRLRATLRFMPSNLQSSLDLEGGGVLQLPRRRIPVALLDAGANIAVVIARDVFSGQLWLYRYDGTRFGGGASIAGRSDAQPVLRAAAMHDGKLVAVLYDNARSTNEVVTLALPRDEAETEVSPVLHSTLASLEDPAGGTYEMIPTIRLLAMNGGLFALGGTLLQEVSLGNRRASALWRLSGCLRAQDSAIVGGKLRVLCISRAESAEQPYLSGAVVTSPGIPVFRLLEWSAADGFRELSSVETDLVSLTLNGDLFYADGPDALRRIMTSDLQTNHASGVMELGINNVEGRVAWSQIYFLNGLIDLLWLAMTDEGAAELWLPLLTPIRQRLDIEVYLLNQLLKTDYGFRTNAFTVGREPALFAVQTSRLLLLFNRYRRLFPDGVQLSSLSHLRRSVLSLEEHIDVLATAGPGSLEPEPGRRYLHWPKGSAFYFDGLNVPYNHQNEWAYAVFDTLKYTPPTNEIDRDALAAATDIVTQFLSAIASQGEMPVSGMWPYWWGRAREGWIAEQSVSQNRPEYAGDKLTAWISFRSIDAMTVLAASTHLQSAREPKLRNSIATLVHGGLLFPFVASGFEAAEKLPLPNRATALAYARMTAPSDLQSSVYAHYALYWYFAYSFQRRVVPD
jgi:hypothetical protein